VPVDFEKTCYLAHLNLKPLNPSVRHRRKDGQLLPMSHLIVARSQATNNPLVA